MGEPSQPTITWISDLERCGFRYRFAFGKGRKKLGTRSFTTIEEAQAARADALAALSSDQKRIRLARQKQQLSSVVYFLVDQETQDVKIGWSTAVTIKRRIEGFQTGHQHELRLLGTVPGPRTTEQEYHRRFAQLRIRGEWFRMGPELAEELDRLFDSAPYRLPTSSEDGER